MKQKLLSTSLLMCFSIIVWAQEQTFVYEDTRGMTRLTNESDTITLFDYYSIKKGPRERRAQIGGNIFVLSVSRQKDRIQTISNEDGAKYATVSLGTKDRYDIRLEDGTVLECSVTGRTWVYTVNGKEVITGSLKREHGQKKIVLSGEHLNTLSPVVILSVLERDADKYASSASTGPMIISAVILALARTAMMNNSGPQY